MAHTNSHNRTSAAETLNVEYAEERKPLSGFPLLLVRYLTNRFSLQGRVLDVMCGRGEHMTAFETVGLEAWGTDISPSAGSAFGRSDRLSVCNLMLEKLPFPDCSFDVIFCKSAVEHVNPDHLFSEFSRVLRPSGKVIALTPDWYYTYRYFYIDHTHGYGVPFTKNSMDGILKAWGFTHVVAENIYYLPSTWGTSILTITSRLACVLVRALPYPYDFFANRNNKLSKFVRFANEIQVLGFGVKN